MDERHIQACGCKLLDRSLLVNHWPPVIVPRLYFSTLCFEPLGDLVGVGGAAAR